MTGKTVFCLSILTLGLTSALAAQPLPEKVFSKAPAASPAALSSSLGNCNTYSNSRVYHPADYEAYCAGTGPGCTECVNFPGGGTVGTCYVVDSNTTICVYNQIAPWTNL